MIRLRAQVQISPGWFEARLLDLDIVADGETVAEVRRGLAYALTAEYHLDLKHGRTPFAGLLPDRTAAADAPRGKVLAATFYLDLPAEVQDALSAALTSPTPAAPAARKCC